MPRVPSAVVAAILLSSTSARAGGQLVGDNGSQGTQRGGAFAAKADDPSALWFNPAGFAISESLFYLGANVVSYQSSFRRAGEYQPEAVEGTQPEYVGDPYPLVEHQGAPQPVPMIAAGFRRGRLGLGLGVMAPHGYGRRAYDDEVDTRSGAGAPAPQRYDTMEQEALIVLPSVAAAVQVTDTLSLGVRASVGYAQLATRKAVQGVSNGAEDPRQDSIVTVAARDTVVPAFAAGLHWKASRTVEVGLVYTAPVRVGAVGTSSTVLGEALREPVPGMETSIEPVAPGTERCAPGGVEGALAACVDFALPQTATAAMRYVVRDEDGFEIGDVELDVRWENWSRASDIVAVVDGQNSLLGSRLEDSVVRHGFRDVWSVRLGGAGLVEGAARTWHVRGGVAYENGAAPESWTRVDVDGNARMTAALGVGVDLGRWRLDLGGSVIVQPRRNLRDVAVADDAARVQPDIGVPLNPADDQPYNPFNAGSYDGGYWIASLGLVRAL
jgi:long-chain fatty acid transport protein